MASYKYFLGCDLGSSSCKAVVIRSDGRCEGSGQHPYQTSVSQSGAAEQNPLDWIGALFEASQMAVRAARIRSIAALSVVGVTHSAVLLDEDLKPVRRVLTMFDTRSSEEARQIAATYQPSVLSRTLNSVSSLWTWPHLAWIRRNDPAAWERSRWLVFPKDFVRMQLCPELCTDVIDAAGTLLFDPRTENWIQEYCEAVPLDGVSLPPARQPQELVGVITAAAADRMGIDQTALVVVGTTDTAAEMLGCGAVEPGDTMLKLASVGRVARTAGFPIETAGIINYRHVFPQLWYPGTAAKHAASAFAWLRRILWNDEDMVPEKPFELMSEAAAAVPPGSDGLLFIPHLSGSWAPHWNDAIAGQFANLRMGHGRGHLSRAVMEGVAFSMRRAHKALSESAESGYWYLIGQGSNSPVWREIMAAVFDHSLQLPAQVDAAFGGALLAAIGTGHLPMEARAVKAMNPSATVDAPTPDMRDLYSERYQDYCSLDDVAART